MRLPFLSRFLPAAVLAAALSPVLALAQQAPSPSVEYIPGINPKALPAPSPLDPKRIEIQGKVVTFERPDNTLLTRSTLEATAYSSTTAQP